MNNTTGVTERASSRSMAPFFIIWTGQAFSLVGSSLVQFALVWWLTQMSGSATADRPDQSCRRSHLLV
jgi:hypothetical protein